MPLANTAYFGREWASAGPAQRSVYSLSTIWSLEDGICSGCSLNGGLSVCPEMYCVVQPQIRNERGHCILNHNVYPVHCPGVFIWSCIPWFFQIQYAAHWVRSWEFHTLELKDDTFRDPLIPPVDVWTNQNRHFLEEVKIRKERFRQQQERLSG